MLGDSQGSAVWWQAADPSDLQPWSPNGVRTGTDQVQRRRRTDRDPVQVQRRNAHDDAPRHNLERGSNEHLFRAFDLSRHVDAGEKSSHGRPAEYAAGQPGRIRLGGGEWTSERNRAAHRSTMKHRILGRQVAMLNLWISQR